MVASLNGNYTYNRKSNEIWKGYLGLKQKKTYNGENISAIFN